jgi:hypothetical protein
MGFTVREPPRSMFFKQGGYSKRFNIHLKVDWLPFFFDFSKASDSVKWAWIRAVLLHYNLPDELVTAVMSMNK